MAAPELERIEPARGNEPATSRAEKAPSVKAASVIGAEKLSMDKSGSFVDRELGNDGEFPTDEEMVTLRRVSGQVPWTAYTVAFVELCERFSYYGTIAVFVNFIQQPLPEGSDTGAGFEGQSGALGMGQRASTGLTTFNAFWAYVMPLLGAYMADEHWGRYKTIMVAIGIAVVGHIILIISAIPAVIVHPERSIACFSVGLVIMGIGVGGFKSNISPLIAEQYKQARVTVETLPDGERVVKDPTLTISRIYMYFYMMINIGALCGSVAMVYAEKYVGFWLSYTLPTIMFLLCPMVLLACRNKYARTVPTGSVTSKAWKLWKLSMKGQWSLNPMTLHRNINAPDFWDRVKPSKMDPASKPNWMTFDDEWVDQVRRGLKACTVFLWYPIYWLAYNQCTNNLTSQAATMQLNGVPNDIINNLNPLSLVIFIPIFDQWIYPTLRKWKIRFTPLKRITAGFFMGTLAMIWAAVTQHYIYSKSPCGSSANDCEEAAPLNVWIQSGPYVLVAFSEIFASITGLEYAFTKAPKNMRSLVTAVFLFMTAFSSAIGQGLVALSEDPLLVWNYGTVAVLSTIGGIGFWLTHRKLDAEEDALNMLPDSAFMGKQTPSTIDSEKGEY